MTGSEKRLMKEASENLHKSDAPYKRASNAEFVVYLLAVIVAALCVRTFIFEPVRVVGSSMYPTLINGEGMFVEKLTYMVSAPRRGDIIICRYPGYPVNCVKRVIGLPGDTVEVRGGEIYLNGNLLDESGYWNDVILDDMDEITVPERRIFVVGDNRNFSDDSRRPYIGPIPIANVKGRVRFVLLPPDRARRI